MLPQECLKLLPVDLLLCLLLQAGTLLLLSLSLIQLPAGQVDP